MNRPNAFNIDTADIARYRATSATYEVDGRETGRDYVSAYMYARGRADATGKRVALVSTRDDANGQRVLCATVYPVGKF
jgi:hypothetical protein